MASQWAVEEFSLAADLVDITEVPVVASAASVDLAAEVPVVVAQAEAGDS